MIFLGLKFWPKVIFWGVYKRHQDFFGLRKKTSSSDFLGLQKKDKGIFLGMLKRVVIFLGREIPKL